jgi:hypothetical protein
MSRSALPEEKGAGLRRDRVDPVPEGLRHSVNRIDDHDGPPFDKCSECGESGSIGSINPFAECPARSLPSDIEARADSADADDAQASLARTDGGRSA